MKDSRHRRHIRWIALSVPQQELLVDILIHEKSFTDGAPVSGCNRVVGRSLLELKLVRGKLSGLTLTERGRDLATYACEVFAEEKAAFEAAR